MHKILVPVLALIVCSACVSNVASPVGDSYRSALILDGVTVALPAEDRIPDRYDRSVMEYLETDNAMSANGIETFMQFASERGGLREDRAGELMLEYLIEDELNRRLTGVFRGSDPAVLEVDIVSTTFPNAATMMLVGEIISVGYDFELTVGASGQIAVSTTEPLTPIVDRSAGAGGGLLGLALRGGENRHLRDLQNMATAVSEQLTDILAGRMLLENQAERVSVQPLN